tara:strand:- start:303 stop:518 length:216 start_codon:yes stop_codon:yes gene_type:complete
MTPGEQAAYFVAEQQRERIIKSSANKQLALNFVKGSLNLAGVGLTALIALILTLVFWPAAIVFLLFCLLVS